jgi:tripartite-type tricarboxylate transporter receptor subunit TctC
LVAKAAPDGYTLQYGNISIAIAHSYYRKLPYNALTDLVPVSLVSSFPQVATVNPSLPARSIKELIALAKTRPGEVLFSSVGNGQADHMAGELFGHMAGVKLTHVPYKGGPQAIGAVISGEVALGFTGLPVAIPQIRAGKVRALAVTAATRTATLPQVPTVAESGVPGYEHSIWAGVFAPAGTPQPIVAKVSEDLSRVLKDVEVRKKLAELNVEIAGSTPESFTKFFKVEIDKWAGLLKATGIRGD